MAQSSRRSDRLSDRLVALLQALRRGFGAYLLLVVGICGLLWVIAAVGQLLS